MLGGFLRRHLDGVDPYFRSGGRLIGTVDAGEVLEGARSGLLVETFDVARPIPIVGSQSAARIARSIDAFKVEWTRGEWYAVLEASMGERLP